MQLLGTGKQTFFDNNGDPLAGGKVYFYVPGTTTEKDTWQDRDGDALNTNPVILDAAGRAVIWGEGAYRQIVHDADDNLIWDQIVTTDLELSLGLSVSIDVPLGLIVVALDRALDLLEDAEGSVGHADTAPTTSVAVDLQKNDVSIGTITFAADSKTPTFDVTATSFAAGDWITFEFPASDMADVGITLMMFKP